MKPGNRIILIDSFGKYGVIGYLLSILFRVPLVIRMRGNFYQEINEVLNIETGLYRWIRYYGNRLLAMICFKRAKIIVYNSHYLKSAFNHRRFDSFAGVVHNPIIAPSSKNNYIHSDLPTARIKLLSVSNFLLYSKASRILYAIDKWIDADFLEQHDIQWFICGCGYYLDKIRLKILEKGYEGRIHAVGWQSDVSRYYKWCDVFVHLSDLDAFPNSTLEAMYYSKPVITNIESCGTKEQVIHDYSGKIVIDESEFRQAIDYYEKNTVSRSLHGKNGQSYANREYSIDKQTEKMKKILSLLT
jgi:glycosyltransferase involved in cell wall biosynthesis